MQDTSEPTHSVFGTPLSEWIKRVPNELPTDAVGLWQVVPPLIHDFNLPQASLEQAVRLTVRSLLSAGALPVEGTEGEGHWTVRADLMAPGDKGVDLIIDYWRGLGRDPDVGDLWFALPQDVA